MNAIKKKIPTKIAPTKQTEIDDEEDELEEDDTLDELETETETDIDDTDDVEETEEETDEEETEELVGLPDVIEPISDPDVGFDFFEQVHSDLKAAGYVTNKAQTKEIVKYIHQMIFFDAFENAKHDIPGLGFIYSEIKPGKTMTATSDFGGKKKGETYEVPAKHSFGFKMSGAAKTRLAEISELDGWSPEDFLNVDEDTEDEE